MADRCDVPGCEQEARLFGPTRRRCLAHADGQAPSLRSDVPAPLPIGEPERRVWRQRVAVLLHREIDARHAAAVEAARAEACHDALDAILLRHAEAERCLETWGALSTDAALRALRGETT